MCTARHPLLVDIILVDDDGDEFPIRVVCNGDPDVSALADAFQLADELVSAGTWKPAGRLRLHGVESAALAHHGHPRHSSPNSTYRVVGQTELPSFWSDVERNARTLLDDALAG